MNARKTKAKALPTSVAIENTHLRVLSASQHKKVTAITRDWRKFTYSVYGDMLDKI